MLARRDEHSWSRCGSRCRLGAGWCGGCQREQEGRRRSRAEDSVLPAQGVWVQPLVRELGSHTSRHQEKKVKAGRAGSGHRGTADDEKPFVKENKVPTCSATLLSEPGMITMSNYNNKTQRMGLVIQTFCKVSEIIIWYLEWLYTISSKGTCTFSGAPDNQTDTNAQWFGISFVKGKSSGKGFT